MLRKTFIFVVLLLLVTVMALPVLADSVPPNAKNDSLNGLVGDESTFPAGTLFADNGGGEDDLGSPEATIESFGGGSMGGAVTDNAAGTSGSLAGGTLTVNADGSLVLSNPTQNGLFIFIYRLRNSAGFDDASVTFEIREAPDAERDIYIFLNTADQNKNAADGLFADNGSGPDNLGAPEAKLVSFGSGSLGGTVGDNAAGASVPLAGGTLTVNSNGAWSLSGAPFTTGIYTFRYEIANTIGASEANVRLSIHALPVAEDDDLGASLGQLNDFPAGALFADNGSGADNRGFPEANLTSFGGGALGGDVADNSAGSTVALAGGTLTVNKDGSMVVDNPTTGGTYKFQYRLTNAAGTSDATVTLELTRKPVAADDAYTFMFTVNQSFDKASGLFADNGSGVDKLGDPEATVVSFGGGSLGGDVTSNSAGATVSLAGGTLTVNSDGGWSLSGQPFDHGVYTFFYRLENGGGASDATVTVTIEAAPDAENDSLLANLGSPFAGNLFAYNGYGVDDLGTPVATLTSFGGGTLGGDVTSNAAGSSVPLNGGTLVVNADGSITVSASTPAGGYVFDYRLTNVHGTSDALVTIIVSDFAGAAPTPEDDALQVFLDVKTDFDGGTLFEDNGHGKDLLGFPLAGVVSFGGGDLGGTAASNAAGSTVDFAGGELTVNADGSMIVDAPTDEGTFSFDYRLENKWGAADATVTIQIAEEQQMYLSYSPVLYR